MTSGRTFTQRMEAEMAQLREEIAGLHAERYAHFIHLAALQQAVACLALQAGPSAVALMEDRAADLRDIPCQTDFALKLWIAMRQVADVARANAARFSDKETPASAPSEC